MIARVRGPVILADVVSDGRVRLFGLEVRRVALLAGLGADRAAPGTPERVHLEALTRRAERSGALIAALAAQESFDLGPDVLRRRDLLFSDQALEAS